MLPDQDGFDFEKCVGVCVLPDCLRPSRSVNTYIDIQLRIASSLCRSVLMHIIQKFGAINYRSTEVMSMHIYVLTR